MLGDLEYVYMLQSIQLTYGQFTIVCTSRGCPFKCRYCFCAPFSLRKWRPRSAENIVPELEEIRDRGYESVTIVDDNFTHDRKRVEKICELLRKKKKISLHYYFEGRLENASREMLRMMRHCGFNVVYFGIESAYQHVLSYYDKRITSESSARAVENAKKAGMLVVTSYIFGAPVETREDINRSIEFIRSTRPHAVQINVLDCLVGTPIWEEMRQKGILPHDAWKRNYRIYEFEPNSLSENDPTKLVRSGYHNDVAGWENPRELVGFLRTMLVNASGRKIVLTNLFKRDVMKVLSEDIIGNKDEELR